MARLYAVKAKVNLLTCNLCGNDTDDFITNMSDEQMDEYLCPLTANKRTQYLKLIVTCLDCCNKE